MKKYLIFLFLVSSFSYVNAQEEMTDITTESTSAGALTTEAPETETSSSVEEPLNTPESHEETPIERPRIQRSPDAEEEGSGWYVGGAIGVAHVIVDVKRTPVVRPTEKSRLEVGVAELYGGHSFDKNFAIDFSLKAYGDVSDDDDDIFEASLFTFSAMPKFTANLGNRVELYGKAGIALVAYSEYYDDAPSGADESEGWAGLGVTACGGLQIELPKGVHLQLAYEYLKSTVETGDDNEYDTGTVDVELRDREITSHRLSLGAHYQF